VSKDKYFFESTKIKTVFFEIVLIVLSQVLPEENS
jgi:hypothetical protein